MVDEITIMVTAVILAVGVMMFSARPISWFVNRHPTVKVLALSLVLLIGVSLVGDGPPPVNFNKVFHRPVEPTRVTGHLPY